MTESYIRRTSSDSPPSEFSVVVALRRLARVGRITGKGDEVAGFEEERLAVEVITSSAGGAEATETKKESKSAMIVPVWRISKERMVSSRVGGS